MQHLVLTTADGLPLGRSHQSELDALRQREERLTTWGENDSRELFFVVRNKILISKNLTK
jgi:hypothetical protein